MNDNELASIVIKLSADVVEADPANVTRQTQYVADLEYDSLDSVNLGMKLEDEFDVRIADSQLDQLKTVGDAIDCIAQLRAARNTPSEPASGHT